MEDGSLKILHVIHPDSEGLPLLSLLDIRRASLRRMLFSEADIDPALQQADCLIVDTMAIHAMSDEQLEALKNSVRQYDVPVWVFNAVAAETFGSRLAAGICTLHLKQNGSVELECAMNTLALLSDTRCADSGRNWQDGLQTRLVIQGEV